MIPLRPLGVGEILDGAISAARANPRTTFGLAAVVVTISQVLLLVVSWWLFRAVDTSTAGLGSNPTPEELNQYLESGEFIGLIGAILLLGLAALIIGLLSNMVLTGLLTVVVSKAVIGQQGTVGEAWATVRPQFLRLIGLTLLVGFLSTLGLVFCLIPGVFLWALWGLSTPALILERQPVIEAMRRSARLVLGSWWRVFLILLLAAILAAVISYIIAVPFQLIGGGNPLDPSADPDRAFSFFALSMSAIAGIIAGTITSPFVAGVSVLLYVDQRMRREGLDLELARAAGVNVPGQPPQYGPGQAPQYGPGSRRSTVPASHPQVPPSRRSTVPASRRNRRRARLPPAGERAGDPCTAGLPVRSPGGAPGERPRRHLPRRRARRGHS